MKLFDNKTNEETNEEINETIGDLKQSIKLFFESKYFVMAFIFVLWIFLNVWMLIMQTI